MNWLKTTFLMALLTGLFVAVGYFIGGESGMVIAFAIAVFMNFGTYWYSDKIVLSMYKAQEVTQREAPEVYSIVESLVNRANMPMPKVYIIPSDQPNAFATGRDPNHAAVAVTDGILRILNREELEGVLAHELAHVKHRDILISSIAATTAGAIMMLRFFGLFFGGSSDDEGGGSMVGMLIAWIVAPIAAVLIQMAISRSREYGADKGGAEMCGNPHALASALRKLHAGVERNPMPGGDPATAHLFIVNPFSGGGMATLFSTHPPMKERISRLESMQISGKFA